MDWTYIVNDNNQIEDLKCINVLEFTGNINIPATIDEKEVVEIGSLAFENATEITGITIPVSVTRINELAFGGCINLTNIDLGNIQEIGGGAFFADVLH